MRQDYDTNSELVDFSKSTVRVYDKNLSRNLTEADGVPVQARIEVLDRGYM